MYDCIIIGGGPAGMTAALYLARKKMKIVMLTDELGGQVAKAAMMENYLGFPKIVGTELIGRFIEHIKSANVESKIAEVEKVEKTGDIFKVITKSETLQAKSIIIASGKTPRPLGVPGEKEFLGKGIGYCVTCDGPLYHEKKVAIVGGGNSALDAALEMEKYAKKVYIINLNDNIQGDEVRVDKIKKSAKVEILNNAKTIEVTGEQFVKGLKYQDLRSNTEKEITLDGVFVEIGWIPATGIVKDLVELNKMGEIVIHKDTNETSVPGIYAAGDVTDVLYKQMIIAAGEGAKASLSAWKFIVSTR
jgi:alkyl hydroperoxide reductase subunit F